MPTNPHQDLLDQIASTAKDLERIRDEQAGQHLLWEAKLADAQRALNDLRAVTVPLEISKLSLEVELEDRLRRTLGPWTIKWRSIWPEGYRYLLGQPHEWYHDRAWLKGVGGSNDRVWRADIHRLAATKDGLPEGGYDSLKLGLPTKDLDADFLAHRATVDRRLVEMGYYLVDE